MRNIIQQQDDLKNLPQQQLVRAMQSGTYPQFLVLSEINRRKRMTDDQARREAADDTSTVAQEVVNAAGVPQGGIAQLASAMNAKTDNTQNTGVKQMAEGGVVKMQTAGKPPSLMSNIMSMMSPPSYDIADINRNEAITPFVTPKETGLEAIEGQFLEEEQRKAVELQQAVLKTAKTGKTVKQIAKLLEIEARDAANIIAGSAALILTQTGGFLPEIYGIAKEANEKGSGLEAIRLGKTIRIEGRDFAFRDGLLFPRVADYNPFDERAKLFNKKTEEQLKEEERLRIKRAKFASMGALAQYDKPAEIGGKEGTAASESIFSEDAPVEFLKGTPKNVTPSLPFGPKDVFTGFGDPANLDLTYSRFTKGFPRNLDQVGSPKTDAPVGFPTGQRIAPGADVFPAEPGVEIAPVSASRPSVAEEISRLGRPIQTSMTQPPAINTEGDSDDTLFTNVSRADEPFKLGGKALEEAEAKKAAQIKKLLASEATDLPFSYGPEEMSMITHPRAKARIKEGDVYRPDLNNELAMIRAGLTPKTDLEALNFGDRFLGSKRSFDEFGDPRIVRESPFSVSELLSSVGRLPNYGDAMADVSGRAADYFKDARLGRLNQSPEEVYGDLEALKTDPKFREEPQALQEYFAQTLENQQKAMPGGGGSSGLGALFAQTLENQQEGIPGGTDPNARPTIQSMFDKAKLYLQGKGEDISNMTQEDVINFAKSVARKAGDVVDGVTTSISDEITRRRTNAESKAFDAEDVAVGSEPVDFRAIDKATVAKSEENQDKIDTTAQTQMEKLMELLAKQQAATDKQSGSSSAALSEYLGGLEKDREFDKAMALANAGAALMMPSATIGEGAAKAIKAGTSTLQKGKNSYNKNKLQVLALQGRIDAAKAAAASRSAVTGATLSSRILLSQREELQKQLDMIAPAGTKPRADLADRADELKRQIKEKDDQLNAMIMSASLGSTPTGSDIFASYNLTG